MAFYDAKIEFISCFYEAPFVYLCWFIYWPCRFLFLAGRLLFTMLCGAVVLCGARMLYVPNASRTNYHVIGTDEPFMACNYFYAGMVFILARIDGHISEERHKVTQF